MSGSYPPDVFDVMKYGAVGNGTTNDTPAFNSAASAATGTGLLPAGGFVVAQGAHNFNLASTSGQVNVGFATLGSKYVHPANLVGITDTKVFGFCPFVLQEGFQYAGSSSAGSANQFLMSLQAASLTTNSAAPYEKAVCYISATQSDTSVYTPTQVTRGYHATVAIQSGFDGYAVGLEIKSVNYGSTQTNYQNTQTGKFGININGSQGTSTATIAVRQTGGYFANGIVFDPGVITAGGNGILIPNQIGINSWNSAGNAVYNICYFASNNCLVLGQGIPNAVLSGSHFAPISDNAYMCGESGLRWSSVWAVNGTIQTSVPSLKSEITELPSMLGVLRDVSPITYKWKFGGFDRVSERFEKAPSERRDSYGPRPGRRTHWGFSAPEVKAVFDRINMDFGGYLQSDDGLHHLRPDQLIPVLWKADQELQQQVDDLRSQLELFRDREVRAAP